MGLLLAGIVLVTGRALAYVVKYTELRNTEYRFVWLTMTGLATLSVVLVLTLPVFLTISHEYNLGVISSMVGAPNDASGGGPPIAPDLTWMIVLQLAALIVGLILSTLWALGDEYRRRLRGVVGGYAKIERKIAKTREQLETLVLEDEATLSRELAEADFRYYEFCRYQQRSAAAAGQPPPEVPPPPDHSAWRHSFRSMIDALSKDLDEQIEENQRQTTLRLIPPPGDGTTTERVS